MAGQAKYVFPHHKMFVDKRFVTLSTRALSYPRAAARCSKLKLLLVDMSLGDVP